MRDNSSVWCRVICWRCDLSIPSSAEHIVSLYPKEWPICFGLMLLAKSGTTVVMLQLASLFRHIQIFLRYFQH